MTFIDITLD